MITLLLLPSLHHNRRRHMLTSCLQSGRQKMAKLEEMTMQVRAAEQQAGIKTSRLLHKLLKLSSDTKHFTKPEIAGLTQLYRCVHPSGKVVWISDDDEALRRAKELGFLEPDLRSPDSDMSDDEVDALIADATDNTDKGGSDSAGSADSSDARKCQVPLLTTEVQNLNRRLTSLDVDAAVLDAAVATMVKAQPAPRFDPHAYTHTRTRTQVKKEPDQSLYLEGYLNKKSPKKVCKHHHCYLYLLLLLICIGVATTCAGAIVVVLVAADRGVHVDDSHAGLGQEHVAEAILQDDRGTVVLRQRGR
jgi:hypothetical protein